jgi:hypothetical protein
VKLVGAREGRAAGLGDLNLLEADGAAGHGWWGDFV